jgi:hypothetical protein
MTYGQTDEFGHKATFDVVTPNDFQATILNQLGLDHSRLTYLTSGRAQTLTNGQQARVIREILA